MNILLSFMDKLYSDTKTLSIVYIAGAVLLFIFIVMLIISLRKPKDEPKIIEEPKIEEEPIIEEIKEEEIVNEPKEETIEEKEISEEPLTEQSIFEKTVIIPLNELASEIKPEEKTLENILDTASKPKKDEIIEEKQSVEEKISTEIPNVDDFVDNIVKKTYEKNEQFSSVYVGDKTSTIKLDKVMENLNVDENVVESIVPGEEKTVEPEITEETKVEEVKTEEPIKEEVKETTNSLDNLKKALDEKKREVSLKQDDLKAKLDNLKQNKN